MAYNRNGRGAQRQFNNRGNNNARPTTKRGTLLDVLKEAISLHTKVNPSLSTAGGTSDGRFIAPLGTKVVEFGPLSTHIHKVNEAVSLNSLEKLKDIFVTTLEKLF